MTDSPGRMLAGKYELVEQLGRGGMAVVWRAIAHGASGFARPVAIKRIESQVIGLAEVVEMFEKRRVSARLEPPQHRASLRFRPATRTVTISW